MNKIQLVSVQNLFSAKDGALVQEFKIDILVEDLGCHKQIAVHWTGDNNVWHVLPADYQYSADRGRERWAAKANFLEHSPEGLPGNIRFALQYLAEDREYWEDNHQLNFSIKAGAGILLGPGFLLSQIDFQRLLPQGETAHPVVVAVHKFVPVGKVFIRWSTDNWQTVHRTPCFLQHDYWNQKKRGHRGNSHEEGVTVWTGKIKVRNGFRVEYAIGCEAEQAEIWDNNSGGNYFASRAGLKILTLNLHCYQEANQDDKFNEIARAILENDIDVVCLQEVGEEWNGGEGFWLSNAARIIQERLQVHGGSYELHTDWSHIGFDHFREGSAILSKHRILKHDARYVSDSNDIHDIHARKVVMAQIHFPYVGLINVFSVHLSWSSGGFQQQFEKLQQWANDMESDSVVATFLCGDFNNKAGSSGYMQILGSAYEDQFLRANSPDIFARVFRDQLPGNMKYLASDERIDFLFAKRGNKLQPTAARVLFAGQEYKMVSDHLGYLAEFEPE